MRAILTYHSLDDSGSPISVPFAIFTEHVNWLLAHGVRILPLDALVRDDDAETPAVAITFDDGFVNTGAAASWLGERGLPMTLFVVSGHVGGDNRWYGRADAGIPTLPLLGWSELERLVASNHVSIGAHTRTHPRLTTLAAAAIDQELFGCCEDVRARLGVDVRHFAYPYGDLNDEVRAIARRRFALSVTTRFGTIGVTDALHELPRLDMYYFRQPRAIESWDSPRFERQLHWVRLRRRVREVLT